MIGVKDSKEDSRQEDTNVKKVIEQLKERAYKLSIPYFLTPLHDVLK